MNVQLAEWTLLESYKSLVFDALLVFIFADICGDLLCFHFYLFLKQSIFYGGVEIHDRHRDMRLDIDNMSYEVSIICRGITFIFIQAKMYSR